MQSATLNLIVSIAMYIIGSATVVVGYIYANRTVQEGVARDIANRRELSATSARNRPAR